MTAPDANAWAERCVRAMLDAGDPARAVARAWPERITAPVSLLAFGKAATAMTRAALELLGPALARGLAVGPAELAEHVAREPLAGVTYLPADHPLPTPRNIDAAARVEAFVAATPEDHTLVVLVSGGGSAYLTAPAPGLTLENLRDATRALQASGADIRALNAVRKHAERLKGGRLGAMCRAQRIEVLLLSDVLGDPPDVIASGPFAPDSSTLAEAINAIESRGLGEPARGVLGFLRDGANETPKPGDARLARIAHRVIASNAAAVDAVVGELKAAGFATRSRTMVEGEASALGRQLAREIDRVPARPAAIVWGGEWTVSVGEKSAGIGGPSQELALAAALALEEPATVLAFSTDGIDGPPPPASVGPPAAGAVVHGPWPLELVRTCRAGLESHDARRALASIPAEVGRLLFASPPGPTGTNINHVAVALAFA
jgi:glycerate 2-kinase